MTLEEKAKAYDNVRKKITIRFGSNVADEIFSQFEMSEDEKIRKEIIRIVDIWTNSAPVVNGIPRERLLAWLEKQGDLKSADKVEPKFKVGDKIKLAKEPKYPAREIIAVKNDAYYFDKFVYLPFSRQDEWELVKQKPVDNVGSKFHKGDWIIYDGWTTQIKEVYEDGYSNIHRGFIPKNREDSMRLWTIQDAKDGDVLATENFIFIFKNIDNGNGVHYYCHYEISKHEDDNQFGVALPQSLMGRVGNSISHYFPATKEQRDTLEKAMADAGYTFDFKKKELKKIEQKLCMIQWKGDNLKEVIDFTGKDKNFDKWFASFEEYERYVYEHNNIFKLFNKGGSHYEVPVGAWIVKTPDGYNTASRYVFRQKPAWSEEDDEIHRKCICAMRASACGFPEEEKFVEQVDNWLKSLKDRVQPKQEWNKEDDQYLLVCKNALRKYQKSDNWDAEIISHWLENKLKDMLLTKKYI